MAARNIRSLPLERELVVAAMSPYLLTIDVHGMRRDEVVFEVEQFIGRHPGECVRVIFGAGTGALAEVVTQYLQGQIAKRIDGFLVDDYRASCVMKIR